MICKVISRSDANVALFMARGSYEFGLLDAGTAGTARLSISAGARGMNYDVVKSGSLLHIFPQYEFDHWYGLLMSDPVYDHNQRTYTLQALELHGFLAEIQSVASFMALSGSGESGAPIPQVRP